MHGIKDGESLHSEAASDNGRPCAPLFAGANRFYESIEDVTWINSKSFGNEHKLNHIDAAYFVLHLPNVFRS
jgi:hypothetical protein